MRGRIRKWKCRIEWCRSSDMTVSIAHGIRGRLIEDRVIVVGIIGESCCRGIDAFMQGDVNVADSFKHLDGGQPGVRIIVIPCGANKSVPQVAKPTLEFR
jgi:hypothetical protein